MGPADAIRDLAEPLLAAAGLELWDVEVAPDAVRVFVERDGGIDLDGLAVASTALSGLLDGHPELVPGGRWELEVSSPGIERTLRTPEHHRRYVGSTVSVKTTAAVDGSRRWHGTLVEVDDEGIVVAPDGAGPDARTRIPHGLISRTRTAMVWGPAPKPGAGPARSARPARPTTPQPEDARS